MSASTINLSNSGTYAGHLLAYNRGVEAFRKNNNELALDCFRTCVDADPNHWDARMYLAMTLVKAEQPLAAISHFKTIYDWCPDITHKQRAILVLQTLRK